MKKTLVALLGSIFWAVWSGLGVAQEVLQKPLWEPSTVYVYENVDLKKNAVTSTMEQTVLSVTGDQARIRSVTQKTGARNFYTFDLAHLAPVISTTSGVAAVIRFPISPGDSWNWSIAMPLSVASDVTVTWDMKAKFTGWEEVTVQAGTYRTAKIEHSGYWSTNPRDRGQLEMVFWYAPNVGRFVKWREVHYQSSGQVDTQNEFRLIKYQPAPDMSNPSGEPAKPK